MKIVQATITYPPALGGMDRYVRETAEGLAARGNQVTVVTSDLEQPLSRRRVSFPPGYLDLVEVHRLATRRLPRLPFPMLRGVQGVLKKSAPEIIHAHSLVHSPALSAWRYARRERIPFVVNTIFSPRSGPFWRVYTPLMVKMLEDAACTIAISQFEKDLLAQAGFPAGKVIVLAPGVDLAPLQVVRPSIFERFGFEKNRVVVSLSRLAYGKRVDRLIEAFPKVLSRHAEARLLIIGPDYGDESRLRGRVEALNLASYVRFAGALPGGDVTAALQHAAMFAMTTDFELFGITLIEAMAAGTAVVAPAVASVPNVVTDQETGLLYRYNDVDDLAAAICRVLGDAALQARLVAAGRHEASTRFDFQKNLDVLEEIYERSVRHIR